MGLVSLTGRLTFLKEFRCSNLSKKNVVNKSYLHYVNSKIGNDAL